MKKLLLLLCVPMLISCGDFGCISGDCENGQGTFTYFDGKYVGEHKDGERHGQGTYVWANEDKYVGEYKNDKRQGLGTYTTADGTIEKGLWENGEFIGE